MPKNRSTAGKRQNDPLFQLFEHFILTRSYDNAVDFTKQLAQNYLAYLDSTKAHMPFDARETVLEDLANEAHEMLVKRMYGGFDESDRSLGHVREFRDGKVANPILLAMPDAPSKA